MSFLFDFSQNLLKTVKAQIGSSLTQRELLGQQWIINLAKATKRQQFFPESLTFYSSNNGKTDK